MVNLSYVIKNFQILFILVSIFTFCIFKDDSLSALFSLRLLLDYYPGAPLARLLSPCIASIFLICFFSDFGSFDS